MNQNLYKLVTIDNRVLVTALPSYLEHSFDLSACIESELKSGGLKRRSVESFATVRSITIADYDDILAKNLAYSKKEDEIRQGTILSKTVRFNWMK